MQKVESYRAGPVLVEGVVSATSPGEHVLALIDSREFEQCGLGCSELTLPVRWSGPMPAVQQTVHVEGELQQDGGKLIFVAHPPTRLSLKFQAVARGHSLSAQQASDG